MRYKSKERQMKEFIVSLFYKDIPFFNGSITTLAGPDLKRIINLGLKLNPEIINVYETCPKTFEKQVKDKYRYFKGDERIQLYFDSIINAPVTEFIDADLMRTFKYDGKIIESLLLRQKNNFANVTKVFIGTLSMRAASTNGLLKWLIQLLKKIDDNIDIPGEIEYNNSNGSLIYIKKLITNYSSKIKNLDIFEYSDKEGPMLTFRIIY